VSQRMRTVAAVARDPSLLRVQLAFLAFSMAYVATWIAILVYAFDRGGPAEAGLAVAVQLTPVAILVPITAYAGDRFRRDRVLLLDYVAQSASLGLTAVALVADAPAILVFAAATGAAISLTFTRPLQASFLPWLTRTPEELTAANVAAGLTESVGTLAGPLLAAALLATSGPGAVFATFAVLTGVGAVLVAGIHTQGSPIPSHRATTPIAQEAMAGFVTLARESPARLVVIQLVVGQVVVGALDILFVAVAIDLLAMGPGGPGILSAVFGLGSVIGATLSVLLIGRRRLIPPIAVAALLFGVPIALVGISPPVAVLALFTLSGGARTVRDVAGRTLLQRVAPDEVLARVFGVLEGLGQAGVVIGSIVTSSLIASFGLEIALVVMGAFAPAIALLLWSPLRSVDRDAKVPDPEVLSLLRSMPLFAPLPPPTLERLALDAIPIRVPASADVIRQGEEGDRFYVVAEGTLSATRDDVAVGSLGPGDGFGEIALLRDVRRTATVRSLTPARLFALERAVFLAAVTGHPQSAEAAEAVVRRRLLGS
jgi:MFS family permease